MAYQPPYGYGGGSYPTGYGQQPPYAYGGQQNQAALLAALQGQPYQYPGSVPTSTLPTGRGSQIAGGVVGAGTTLAPYIARSIYGSPATLYGRSVGGAAGLGTGASLGLGLATEIGGSLLKPKGQMPTESPFPELTDQYTRRGEGSGEGVLGGAVKWGGRGAQVGSVVPGIGTAIGGGIGALAGAIGGAFNKNAKSAYSDFRTQDAIEAIRKLYQTEGGRLPTDQEVQSILIGQGMDPASARAGTGVVGEKGLYSVLTSLDQNFRREALQRVLAGESPVPPGLRGAMPVGPPTQDQLARMYANWTGGVTGKGTNPVVRNPDGSYSLSPSALGGGGPLAVTPEQAAGTPRGVPVNGIWEYGQPTSLAPTQTPALPGPTQTGTPATTQAGAPAAGLPANADTDGYAAPQYTAVNPAGSPPPGWDAKKWTDPSHQTPKYVVGRILSQFAPTADNMPAVLAEIQKAYPGTTLIGKDTINIPGVGKTDILRGADVGGKGWQWLGEHAQQGKAGGGGGGGGAATGLGSADVGQSELIKRLIASIGGTSGAGGDIASLGQNLAGVVG